MPLTPLARARFASRSVVSALVAALFTALTLTAAAPASAVTHKQAAKRALAALGSKKGTDPVIVFGLTKPVRPGSRVTQSGKSGTVGKAGSEGAFLFYEDSGPYQSYKHPGRVALVGAKSGKVTLSKTIMRAPRVNDRMLPFLTTPKRYASSKYRVFSRSASTGSLFANEPFGSTPLTDRDTANKSPNALPQEATVKQNKPKNLTLAASDDDGDFLTYAITDPPQHGTLSGQLPYPIYTPNPGYLGSDKFAFKAFDDASQSNTAHVTLNVVPLGSPPVVTATAGGCTAYTEQTPAVVVDSLIGVSDPDDTTLDSARVRILAYLEENGDDLLFTDQNGITGSYDDSTGELTLAGTATVANYQTALRSVRYRNLSDGSPTATKDVEFRVNDAGSDSAPATRQICITEDPGGSNNNKPVIGTSEGSLDYIENDGPVSIDPGAFITDPDSAELSGATVKFTQSQPPEDDEGNPIGDPVNGFTPAEDELAFEDQNGITGSYNDALGVLTLTGTASVADYEAAIRSVTYENSSEDPSATPRTLRLQVKDSSGAFSAASNRGLFVTPVNDAPVVTPADGPAGYTEGDPLTAIDSDLTAGDVDDTNIEGGQVRISDGFQAGDELFYVNQAGISGVYDTETGVLTLSGTATEAEYQTALRSIQFRGTDDDPVESKTVEYVINDGDLDSIAATKLIAVTPVNDKPVLDASDGNLSYTENDGAVAIDPGIAASDVDSDTFAAATIQITGNFAAGEDALTFEPQLGIEGDYDSENGILALSGTASVADYQTALASVSYINNSDNPSTATRTVTFQVDDGGSPDNLSDPVTRGIDVTAVNDAPEVTTSAGSSTHVKGGPASLVDADVTVADVDDENIESAEVRIASAEFEAGDQLELDEDSLAGDIAVDFFPETGILTLTGSATVEDYRAALAAIGYQHVGETAATSKTIEFVVNDGNLDSATASKSVDLVEPNEAPVVTTSAGSTPYTIDDALGVEIDNALIVTDADDADLVSARVQIVGAEPGDQLIWADQPGITGEVDETGVLNVSGIAPVADYEAALRTVKFRHLGGNIEPTRAVEFFVNDGTVDSAAGSKTIDLSEPLPEPEI
jgi:hypothetical protein